MNAHDPDTPRCPRADDLLAALLDGGAVCLSTDLEAHVAACPACARLRADFQLVAGRLRALPAAPAPDLAGRVLARTVYAPTRRGARPLALAAGLLLALTLGLAAWRIARPVVPVVAAGPEAAEEVLRLPATSAPVVSAVRAGGTEGPAVARAVDWLIAAQEPHGEWSAARWGAQPNYTVGVTALGLLALLTAGPDDQAALPAAGRAAEFLQAQQQADGLFGPVVTGSLYNHALACLALLEVDARAPGRVERGRLLRGLDLLARAQHADGGWSYLRAQDSPANSSLTVWGLLALTRAGELGLRETEEGVARGLAWLERNINEEGRVGYRRAGDFPRGSEALTAAAAVCLIDGPSADSGRLKRVLERVRSDVAGTGDQPDFYRTFFQAVALREAGFQDSAELARVEDRLFALQERSGEAAGSWPTADLWARAGGRVYSTALAVLALQDR